jgi:DnaJ-class molecular chaperone
MTRHRCQTRVRKEDGALQSRECPTCDGSGSVQRDDGETRICARCEGTGVLFVDEDAGDALSDAAV